MKFKIFIAINLLCLFYLKPNNQTDPFSEIKITSKSAICQKDKNDKTLFDFTYIDDVLVIFADGSSAKSEKLSIEINTRKAEKKEKKKQTLNSIKQITLSNNVFLIKENRNIKADRAEIYPATKICKLYGNIKIEQTKKNNKDFPIITECQNAIINLETEQISFLGNKKSPVSTTIKLEGHPGLLKKKKKSKEK